MYSVPITTKLVSSNPAHGKMYPIHYNWYNIIKFVSDLWQVCGFLSGTMVSSTNKTDSHIIEILLKVALNTITLTLLVCFGFKKRVIYTELDIYVVIE